MQTLTYTYTGTPSLTVTESSYRQSWCWECENNRKGYTGTSGELPKSRTVSLALTRRVNQTIRENESFKNRVAQSPGCADPKWRLAANGRFSLMGDLPVVDAGLVKSFPG